MVHEADADTILEMIIEPNWDVLARTSLAGVDQGGLDQSVIEVHLGRSAHHCSRRSLAG